MASETRGKKVDFCLHIEPGNGRGEDGTSAPRAIEALAQHLPENSINHTDFEPLLGLPVTACIETKKPDAGQSATEAKLQVGTWHAAQWKLLERLVRQRQQQQKIRGQNKETDSSSDGCNDAAEPSSLPLPTFLPAIIISGHDWSLVATTREGRKTVHFSLPYITT